MTNEEKDIMRIENDTWQNWSTKEWKWIKM